MGPSTERLGTLTPLDPARLPQVAALKRLFELWTLDPRFHEAYLADPASALATTGLDVDPRAASLTLLHRFPEGDTGEIPESFAWYRDFVEGRFARNMRDRSELAPLDPRFRDWRQRQMRRCDREVGPLARFMSHVPVAFELSLGCSIGCSFCAFSVGRLKGVFRHTDINAALWRNVLAHVHELMGDAAESAFCYYATEPLDNPDYELFLADFHEEFERVPQTTTAAATRDLDRTRSLLAWGQSAFPHIDRLSVTSVHDRDLILSAFTPEELVYTDLLPQFVGAPAANLKRAGRNRDAERGEVGTIACLSGFVVNMVERSVRLVTPVCPSDNHPTGEAVYEKALFSDVMDLTDVINGMIERHMRKTITLKDFLDAR